MLRVTSSLLATSIRIPACSKFGLINDIKEEKSFVIFRCHSVFISVFILVICSVELSLHHLGKNIVGKIDISVI